MKFDCIIMNPPYERNLHLKILAEAIKHLKDEKSTCVNLSPIGKIQTAWRKNKIANEIKFLTACSTKINRITCDNAVSIFNLGNIGNDLGVWTLKLSGSTDISRLGKSLTSYSDLIEKMRNACVSSKKMSDILVSADQVQNIDCFVKFVDGLSMKNHGGHGISSYAATSVNFKTAIKFTPGHHVKYVICRNSKEQENCWKTYTNLIIRFFYMTVMGGNTEYDLLPVFDFSKEWTTSNLISFFNITPEEQKVIEETMEKYK